DDSQLHRSAPWPSPPQWESVPGERPSPSSPPAAPPQSPGSVRLPDMPTRIPSCGLYGDRLVNFALRDERGEPWEYKRDFRDSHGKMLLIDFWHSSCQPCLMAIRPLSELQRVYGPYGLQVVGIAYETGTVEEQRKLIPGIRQRYEIKYKTLLSGG